MVIKADNFKQKIIYVYTTNVFKIKCYHNSNKQYLIFFYLIVASERSLGIPIAENRPSPVRDMVPAN